MPLSGKARCRLAPISSDLFVFIVFIIVELVQRTTPLATLNGLRDFLKLFVVLLRTISLKAALLSIQEVVSIVRKFS
jgi:hypothetical protein